MGDARGFFINSLDVEDATSSTEAPNASNLRKNQEVDNPPLGIEDNRKPETGRGVHQSKTKKKKAIPPEAQELIGLIICKECCGVSHLGTVADYNVDRKWFRIEYDDEGSEDMVKQDVLKLLASASQIEEQLQRLRAVGVKEKRVSEKGSTPKPKRRRMDTSGRRADGTYIPLVSRTTKNDDYYWY